MMRVLWGAAISCSALLPAAADKVKVLPGYGEPPTAHHAGFIEVEPSTRTNLFYYLVESQKNPEKDPLIWWMNGGPGASSLAGLFSETGPLLLNEAGKFMNNPYSWNKEANVLYVEFAPGIGYSFCSNSSKTGPDVTCPQERGDCSACLASDTSVARHNAIFIEKLLTEVFPSMKGRPLYLTGESYAGVYIPTLAEEILNRMENTDVVNLHGLWVTDPCTDNKAQFGQLDLGVDFAHRKGLISQDVYHALSDESKGCFSGRTHVGDRIRRVESNLCRRAWRLYDLATAGIGDAVHPQPVPGLPLYIDPLNAVGPTGGADIPGYLNRADVRKALHADLSPNKVYHLELDNNGYSGYTPEYAACNDHPNGKLGKKSMVDVYRSIASKTQTTKAAANLKHIIISSGDLDPVVQLAGTEAAVNAIGFPVAEGGDRRPWYYNLTASPADALIERPIQWGPSLRAVDAGVQVGGFIINYDTKVPGLKLDFVVVRNSGHMVPAYAPQKGLHVIQASLLHGAELAPRLMKGWSDLSDEDYYGWKAKKGGAFTAWVNKAMSSEFVSEKPSVSFAATTEVLV
eukprot:TRINITY_DN110528_c0_g1_i1.p1 TRINITY_DN110528_c0_g1~~TRINITY_DN110528_c0_g1_i1.p1  ORF type:complete len:572 (+),score=100.70 TRINITY_DN110528_c0_g1_i1:62-1777(+)